MKKIKVILSAIFFVLLLSGLLVGCTEEKDCQHSNYKWVIAQGPTCTETGIKEKRCVDCDELLETIQISKKAHSFGDWIVDAEATCISIGSEHHVCKNCGYSESRYIEMVDHSWGDWVVDIEVTCAEEGRRHRECAICQLTVTETIETIGHEWSDWEVLDAQTGTEYKVCLHCNKREETLAFGSYPQTRVRDENTIAELNEQLNGLPIEGTESSNGWTSYNYYKNGEISHFMWYQDVTYNGQKWRAVYYTETRPLATFNEEEVWWKSNELPANQVYWYTWEPLTWNVIGETDDSLLLVCHKVIDAQVYRNLEEENLSDEKLQEEAQKFGTSDIYNWLINTFLPSAFNEVEQGKLLLTKRCMIEGDGNSTVYEEGEYQICLPTEEEAKASCSSYWGKSGTDYAVCQGLERVIFEEPPYDPEEVEYWSPGGYYFYGFLNDSQFEVTVCEIDTPGRVYMYQVDGVVPVIRISK